ncbi:MAG: M28 family peptidase [Bacillota bacterium]|nr:M28 family peptidase [Bacillota bacterium]
MNELFYKIKNELDAQNNYDYARYLTDHFPSRISGTGDDRKAAEYMADKYRSFGLDAKVINFETYNSNPIGSKLTVTYPEKRELKSIVCCHILSTPDEGTDFEAVYVGPGGYDDYRNIDVRGKAVVAEVSFNPGTPEKARIAAEMGAAAILFANSAEDGTPDENLICRRAIKGVWGNPTVESFPKIPQLAAVSISRKDGQYMRGLCEEGRVKIHLVAQATRSWDVVAMPYAVLRGNEEADKYVLVNGHLDAWAPGATCNATGDATMLELARVLAKHRGKLKRSVVFINWNGHEIAESSGSTWYLDHNWDKMEKDCVGGLYLDSTGLKGSLYYAGNASYELKKFVENVVLEATGDKIEITPLHKFGDQSFYGIGVPSVVGRMAMPVEYVERTHGAILGSWMHTDQDDMSHVDPENLLKDLHIALGMILGLSNDTILPYDLSAIIDDIEAKVKNEILPFADKSIDIGSILENIRALKGKIDKFDIIRDKLRTRKVSDEKVILANRLAMKIQRSLSYAFYTFTDRFEQDSYDYTPMMYRPVPLLWTAVELKKLEPETQEYKILYTTVIRNRNRVSEAVNQAIEYCDLFMALLK